VFCQLQRIRTFVATTLRDDQAERTSAVLLVVVGAVAELAESVEENGAGERVSCLSFVQAGEDAPTELDVA
jgi:hypothetical protein